MRKPKPGLQDLRQLQKEAAASRKANDPARAVQQPPDAPDLKARQSDSLLFARAVKSVQPITAGSRRLHTPSAVRNREDAHIRIAQRRARATAETQSPVASVSDLAGMPEDATADLSFAAAGIGPDTLRRLRQAFWPVGAALDLHGLTADKARDALAKFIEQSRSCGTRCVRVIHGVGHGSAQGQPVLKLRVASWLRQLPGVQAYATAPSAHGGRGAVMVLLRLP